MGEEDILGGVSGCVGGSKMENEEIYVGQGKRWENYNFHDPWDSPEPGNVFSKEYGVLANSEEEAREQIQTYLNSEKKFPQQQYDWEVEKVELVPNTSGELLETRVRVLGERTEFIPRG